VKTHRIALYPGDGIGPDVVDAACVVLDAVERGLGGFHLEYRRFDWGMAHYDRHGQVAPDDFLKTLRGFDAIFLGAVGWPERLICADNSGGDLPAIVPCANPKKSFVDGGPDINFDGLSVDGSSLTATWDAFINNFFPTGRATFQHDSYYFQIDGSKPRIVRVTGGTSRVLEQRFTGLEHGVHELVYGTGELSEKILWNVCVKT